MKNISICIFSLFVLAAVGCSDHAKVTGKVTFQDGSPLTAGEVVFEQEAFQAIGKIKPDGTYVMGSYGTADGLPPGTYKVYITGAVSSEAVQTASKKLGADGKYAKTTIPVPVFTKLVHPKYERPETSGLICDVKKSMKYDISVDPPAGNSGKR